MIVLDEPAAADPVVGVVLLADRVCHRLGLLLSVATHSAPGRRLLESGAAAVAVAT
ncbi:hypothetical protein [Streptomyces sp. NPDC002550]